MPSCENITTCEHVIRCVYVCSCAAVQCIITLWRHTNNNNNKKINSHQRPFGMLQNCDATDNDIYSCHRGPWCHLIHVRLLSACSNKNNTKNIVLVSSISGIRAAAFFFVDHHTLPDRDFKPMELMAPSMSAHNLLLFWCFLRTRVLPTIYNSIECAMHSRKFRLSPNAVMGKCVQSPVVSTFVHWDVKTVFIMWK